MTCNWSDETPDNSLRGLQQKLLIPAQELPCVPCDGYERRQVRETVCVIRKEAEVHGGRSGIAGATDEARKQQGSPDEAGEGATPQSAEAALKRPRPSRKMRLRPTRSAIRPAGTSSAPNTMVYALRTQESWAAETCANVARIAGKATKSTVPSSETTNTATLVSASVRQAEEEGVISRDLR